MEGIQKEMKKVYVIKGVVETVFYGDFCDNSYAEMSLKQQVDNVETEAFTNVTIIEAGNRDIPNGQYEEGMFCVSSDGNNLISTISPAEHFQNVDEINGIRAEFENRGWELDEDFEEDLVDILKLHGIID